MLQWNPPEFARGPGGPPPNVAISHVRLGWRAAFIGKVGNDELGEELVLMMNKEKVQTRRVKFDANPRTACTYMKIKFEDGKMKVEKVKECAHNLMLSSELNLSVLKEAFLTEQNKSFDVKKFGPYTKFSPLIALYGDAKSVNGSRSVQISGSGAFSAGRMICRKPINLVEGYPREMVSFSVYFEFSISGGYGDGLGFIMVPIWFPLNAFNGGSMGMFEEKKMKFLAVEFDTFKDEKYGDLNNEHVGIDVGSFVSVKVSNVSSIKLDLYSGEKLQSWIGYEASSKMLEVRWEEY